MDEALGYKTKKPGRITKALQKVVNTLDKISAKKKQLKEFHFGSPHQWEPDVKVLSKSKHLASKEHDCGVCGQKISSGEVHNRIVYMDNQKKFHHHRYHGTCNEDAPTNAMGASSSSSGPIQTFDPMLGAKKARKKMMSRFNKFLYGTLRKTKE